MLLTISLIVFEYVLVMYLFTVRARIRAFTRSFLAQFDKQHSEAFPHLEKAPAGGYPDCGNGYYGKRLPYLDWLAMNNGQRVQINFLEQITFTVVAGFVASLTYSDEAFWTLAAWIVGRLAFSVGYTAQGP